MSSKRNTSLLFIALLSIVALPLGAQTVVLPLDIYHPLSPRTVPAWPSSGPKILVVVDYQKQLALVPQGTVIPNGLAISSCIGSQKADPTGECRPLVFAYGADSNFAAIRTFSEKIAGGATEGAAPLAPAAEGAMSPLFLTTCPDSVLVEFGPNPPNEFFHLVTCEENYYDPSWKEIYWWVYYDDVDAADHRQGYVVNGQLYWLDTVTCDPGDDSYCTDGASWNGNFVTRVDSKAHVREGTNYYNTISYGGW